MVTASHNPPDYNGMKFVREQSRPISADTGLREMQGLIERRRCRRKAARAGAGTPARHQRAATSSTCSATCERATLKPLKVVVNAGNGGAGLVIDQLEPHLPFAVREAAITSRTARFPTACPTRCSSRIAPAPSRRSARSGADLGLAWDGDFDRCFFFDEQGGFIEGYYLVGLLAASFLRRHRGARIVHDPRLTWNTIDIVQQHGGQPVLCKSGHAFIKQKMREVDAVYGGEMSAHHYFRDFAYCDSGMIPVAAGAVDHERVGQAALGAGRRAPAAVSRQRRDQSRARVAAAGAGGSAACWRACSRHYQARARRSISPTGCRWSSTSWRFNLRGSNTEPLVRLNVESRGNVALMQDKTAEVLRLLDAP